MGHFVNVAAEREAVADEWITYSAVPDIRVRLASLVDDAAKFRDVGRWTPVVRMARDLVREIDAVLGMTPSEPTGSDRKLASLDR